MGNYSRDFDRRVAADTKRLKAKTLDRLGLSAPMWESLQALHLARLTRERGQPAPMSQPSLVALERRGLATWIPIDGESPTSGGNVLWRCTEEGAAQVMAGRP